MYESLLACTEEFHLYIFAFDDISLRILDELKLQKVTVISLHEFETQEQLEVKGVRSRAEYCWTCTPSTISYILYNYDIPCCTYLDSDLFFYSDPSVLIEEMFSFNKNVLITEHGFSPLAKLYEKKRAGRFCVQFVTFTREQNSLDVLEKWRLQCIEWCYARHEDGRFGDQKYLDEWPDKYKNVHILKHLGGGVAPWNLQQYRFNINGKTITGIVKKTGSDFKVIFYHFQYVKFLERGYYDIGWYLITLKLKRLFYFPYIKKIEEIEDRLMKTYPGYKASFYGFNSQGIKNILKTSFKKIFGYNLLKI
jgi:hypothetical protein